MNEQHLHYSMLIEWSEADQAYLVTLPEWANRVMMPATHGSTYSEAVQHGQEVLELLMNSAIRDGEPLPPPKTHVAA
ncbi:MAG TPA: type II toxin-antitoxin system HicB family antitoxin [Ktedonobacteraceae bacterium]|jgi:antitoxin HicB|nr:type II toxin-antitoxin system HicB family antitoxin [Ktedonobacteraceae bacterium]